jgi:hypothetical protein
MPTSKQYKLYKPESQQVLVTTVPVFRENSRLQYNWEAPIEEVTIVFDSWEPPKDLEIPNLEDLGRRMPEPKQPREPETTDPNTIAVEVPEERPDKPNQALIGPKEGPEEPSQAPIGPSIEAQLTRRSGRAIVLPEHYRDTAYIANTCHGARSEPRKALVEQSYSTYTKLREEERNGENYS